jgi:fructokinase
MDLYGGIEAGGTKFVCAVGRSPDELHATQIFPTRTPQETIGETIAFFKDQSKLANIVAIGIGSFGPLDPNPRSSSFGYITTTPKPGWANTNLYGQIQDALKIPIGFDTDVNAAALGEHRWGAAQDVETFIYLTIGTGIGGGAMIGGKLVHGLMHPEMGHVHLPHDLERDPFEGICPYHKDCLEGLASGPAIEARWGKRGETLPNDHPAWRLEAHYLALGLVNFITVLSPQRIIMGGGVMQEERLFPLVRREVQSLLNKYIAAPEILEDIDKYIVPPALGGQAGVLGAIALAQLAEGNIDHEY